MNFTYIVDDAVADACASLFDPAELDRRLREACDRTVTDMMSQARADISRRLEEEQDPSRIAAIHEAITKR